MGKNSDPRAATARRKALGQAIRRHRGERSQAELAVSLGISQASMSAWEVGIPPLTCEQVAGVEHLLVLPTGTLLVEAGYVSEAVLGATGISLLAVERLEQALRAILAHSDPSS